MSDANMRGIRDAIQEMLKTYRLDGKMAEVKLVASWEKVMGVMISRHTTEIFIRSKTLFVRLDSAALKNELAYGKEQIVLNLNEEAGSKVIEGVVIL